MLQRGSDLGVEPIGQVKESFTSTAHVKPKQKMCTNPPDLFSKSLFAVWYLLQSEPQLPYFPQDVFRASPLISYKSLRLSKAFIRVCSLGFLSSQIDLICTEGLLQSIAKPRLH